MGPGRLLRTLATTAAAAAIAVTLAVLLWPERIPNDNPFPPADHAAEEWQAKQLLVEQDAALTAQLCTTQCRSELDRIARQLAPLPEQEAKTRLNDWRAGHPRAVALAWRMGDGTILHAGGLPADQKEALEQHMRDAEQAVAAGKPYASDSITAGRDAFIVLGVPHGERSGIVGIMRQSLPAKVKKMQTEQLRLVPYPQEGKYQIESVDTRTHQDITVDHPEENGIASHYHKLEVVVRFASDPNGEEMAQIRRDLGITHVHKSGYAHVFRSSRATAEEMIDYFRNKENALYAEPHYLYMSNDTGQLPNDELFTPYQWNLPIITTIPGWSITKGDENTVVAVIDTGVDLAHGDLAGRLTDGINFVSPEEAPLDDVGHGTHVAGVISATVNNMEGVAGMTWYDRVMPIKVLDATGAGSAYAVARGIIWATDHGAGVINLSLGNYARSEFLHDAIRYAFDRDVVLVAATGNDNTNQPGYPAAYPEVLAVAATDSRRELASFSNYGDYVDVAAPGVNIASTYPDGQYAALSGTSMASPHAAALAALIRSVNPLLRNTEVMDIMRRTATDLGPPGKDAYYGYGQIDVDAALQEAVRLQQSIGLYPEWLRREIERLQNRARNE